MIFKNTFIYSLGNILPQAISYILLPIYTKYLNPSDYGIVSSMGVLSTIFVIFFTLAIDRSIYRIYFDYKDEKSKKDYLGSITISIIVISIIILIILFVFKSVIGQIYKSIDFYPFYVYAILTSFFSIFSIVPKIYYQINEKAGIFIILSILQFILSSSLILWFIMVNKSGAVGMLKGKMLANIVLLPLFIYISYRTINFTFKYKVLLESLKFSIPMIPAMLSAWILNLSDRIFIERYFDLYHVGIYSLGYRVASIVLIFSGAFYKAYNPFFYKIANLMNINEGRKILYKYNNTYIIILIIGVFTISLFSKEIIIFMIDSKYSEAYKIIPIIAFAYLISQIGGLLNLSFYQEKKTLQIMYMILGSAIINIILNFCLIPVLGAYGAAYATVLSFLIFFIIKYIYSKKCKYFIPINWKQIVPLIFFYLLIIILFNYILNINLVTTLIIKIMLSLSLVLLIMKNYYTSIKKYLIKKSGKLIA